MGRNNYTEASEAAYKESTKFKSRGKRSRVAPYVEDRIVHLTAAAAAKAAATALLTNQVIKRVRVTLPNGAAVRFKVERCVIERDSAVCSVVGTPGGIVEQNSAEIWVRVAWEHSMSPVANRGENTPQIIDNIDPHVELHWLTLAVSDAVDSAQKAVPLLLHFLASTPEEEIALREIPRPLVSSAIAEALLTISPDNLERGVRVMIGIAPESTFDTTRLPNLEVKEEVAVVPSYDWSNLNKTSTPDRVTLALDSLGNGILPLLNSGEEGFLNLSQSQLTLHDVLNSMSRFPQLNSITLCGGLASILELAAGQEDGTKLNTFLSQLATRNHLEIALVQNLRDTNNVNDLLRLVSRSHIGWLLDKLCEMACAEIRKQYEHKTHLEVIIFGGSGAILGRASYVPGTLQF